MEKVQLGNSGLSVSRIGLGCMSLQREVSFGLRDTADSAPHSASERETEALHIVSACIDELGVNFFDTADVYGDSELLLGKALALRPRSSYVLATKFGAVGGAAPGRVRGCLSASLERLGLAHVDLYYLHRVDPATPIEQTVAAMAELVREGKTRAIGLSEASAATLRRAHAVHPISAMQSEYSAWFRDVEADVLPACRELGVSLVAYSPLGRGFLAGSATDPSKLDPADFRVTGIERFSGANAEHNRPIALEMAELAKAKGCTQGQLALAWVLAHGKDIIPIPGTSRLARARENAEAAKVVLTAQDVAAIDEMISRIGVAGNRYIPPLLARVNL